MILSRLKEIEIEHDIKIILAVESGTRARGFESADSDYDVRFVYIHKKDWYLHVKPKRDVIEYPIIDEFDFSGWDIKKSLLESVEHMKKTTIPADETLDKAFIELVLFDN